ncbi:vitamin K-dependent protein C-like [Anoplophora glabripennis]|uniref:vitamin K-dependent protein C-like n=1 Tax=Anoplophora glabripennis TaxID=217634 RepID=UPI0008739CC4|nr:vitamin K-dependent protein C-like [Anoplophora glabripennis]
MKENGKWKIRRLFGLDSRLNTPGGTVLNPFLYSVRVGQTFEANGTECDKNGVCAPPYQDINIKRYIFEDYCRGTVRNDLMLVELETPAEFNDFVQPLCLPLTSPPLSSLTGQYVITAGWGLQDGTNKKSLSKKLLYIVTPILNPSTCMFQYIYFERNKQFCLDTPSRMTICDGDSGGAAIMFQRRDGVRRAYFIGVVSYQKKFCTFSPVFTSVQYFLDKILSKTDTNSTLWKSLQKNCGKTRFDPRNQEEDEDRIINGTAAMLGQFPWSVRLGTIYKTRYRFHCGGSLITTTFVISAAHCNEYGNIARVGQTYETMGPQYEPFGGCAPPYQDIKIKKYIFEDYCRVSHVDDLMLLELVRPAKLNNFVQTICLPPSSLPITSLIGKYVVVSGWGLRNGTDLNSTPKNLFYMVTPVLDPDECSLNFTNFDRKRQFCLNKLNNFVQTICLPPSSLPITGLIGKHVVVPGWGPRNGTDPSSKPKNLFYMVPPVFDPDECSLHITHLDRKRQF